jgi:predicted RNA polymerase sigma factor
LNSVLHVLYLVFNEGYTASSGAELHRADLSNEAIRLMREVHKLAPNDPEVAGLLALMLLTDARRAARTGPNRELIPLDEQDRTRWDRQSIAEGVALVSAALGKGLAGEYQLQAAIAALHDEAASAEETDWPQILALYSVLKRMTDNPMVAVSHAIATAMVAGPDAGLALLEPLMTDERMQGNHRLDTARAHLLERVGKLVAAEALYRSAASKTTSTPERNYLLVKAARLRQL